MKFIIMQLIEISALLKMIKNWSVGIFYFTLLLANLSIGQNYRKGQTLKNQIEITIWSQLKALIGIFFTKCVSLFQIIQMINNFCIMF